MENKSVSTQDLGEVILLNEKGGQVKVSTLWRKRTAALVFVRHFG